ncbi:MAG: imelysin family protein, partial [Chloroflexota bacterium]
RATAIAGQVSQAAALADVTLSEEDPTIPDGPIIIQAVAPEAGAMSADGPDLAAVKTYAVDNANKMKAGTEAFKTTAEAYYTIIAGENFDYEAAWANNQDELTTLVVDAKANWLEASTFYELDEGIVAGVPSLAFYDIWIDAGPPASDDPEEALEWQLVLANGETLESPGNFFHNLAEPALFGTNPDFVGLAVDLDGNGTVDLGEALPEAEILLATAQGLDQATGDMVAAVSAWEPTLEETFGALVTMTPTMNEYFEQWKLSAFVSGSDFEESAFVGVSRLFDINGILTGLNFAYGNISAVVEKADPELDSQIKGSYEDLVGYVGELYSQEQDGVFFSPEEADLFGTEAQDRATAIAGQVSQAAALADVTLSEEDPTIPDGPIIIQAVAP